VDDDIADLFADLRPARFAGGDDLAAHLLEVFGQPGNLGDFPLPFGTFEGDELAGDLDLRGMER